MLTMTLLLASACADDLAVDAPRAARAPAPLVRGLRAELRGDHRYALDASPALSLRIHNDSGTPIHIKTSGDAFATRMRLTGPGAVHTRLGGDPTEIFMCGQWATILPGAALDIPITSLRYGARHAVMGARWDAPGRYQLSMTVSTDIVAGPESPEACDQGEQVELSTPPIALHVG